MLNIRSCMEVNPGKANKMSQLAKNRLLKELLLTVPFFVLHNPKYASVQVFLGSVFKIHGLIALVYARIELQLRFIWCFERITREENKFDWRKRSMDEKLLLLTALKDLMIREESAMASAKRSDALFYTKYVRTNFGASIDHLCESVAWILRV